MYLGLDIGSSSSKAVLLGENQESLAAQVVNLGTGTKGVGQVLEAVYRQAGIGPEEVRYTVVTGYGRMTYQGADRQITEISCHAKGVFHLSSSARTIVDVGGQDTKVIRLGQDGSVENFVMNDKCAAGTGKFIEVMATRLGADLNEMYELAAKGQPLAISAMCTVFAESEVISHIGSGEKREDIAAGVIHSVANRVANLAARFGVEENIVLTGGLCESPYFIQTLSDKLEHKVETDAFARYAGALGAALTAAKRRDLV